MFLVFMSSFIYVCIWYLFVRYVFISLCRFFFMYCLVRYVFIAQLSLTCVRSFFLSLFLYLVRTVVRYFLR